MNIICKTDNICTNLNDLNRSGKMEDKAVDDRVEQKIMTQVVGVINTMYEPGSNCITTSSCAPKNGQCCSIDTTGLKVEVTST